MPDRSRYDRHRRAENEMTQRSSHDVIVVGARCAGAATGMLLARQGLDVVVVDRARSPGDTLSTLGISRGGVVQLSRWGLLDAVLAGGAPPVRRVSFHVGGVDQARTVKDRAGVDLLVAPRRYVLDALLADAAGAAGAEMRFGTTVGGVVRGPDGRVRGVLTRDADGTTGVLSARYVVGADGVRSRVAEAVGAPVIEHHPADNATFYAFFDGVGRDAFEFHVADGALAGVFPTHDGRACVWLCCRGRATQALRGAGDGRTAAFVDLVAAVSPALAARLRPDAAASPVRGAVGLPNHVRRAWGPGWALVGDAGYHRDPITGHGITDAFRDAEVLATALGRHLRDGAAEGPALDGYERRRDAALRPVLDITRALTRYPDAGRIVALQKRLSQVLEAEAEALAALPPLPAARIPLAA
jgi:2-polyprenyl-6-methoxyphenol hydroxylase-like FAD-dependent oxidoreductase